MDAASLFGFAVVPDLVLYLKIDVRHLIPRVLESKGMDYWESGMHLKLGSDIFDSFRRYQTRLIREYEAHRRRVRLSSPSTPAEPIDVIQQELRGYIGRYLAGERRRYGAAPVSRNGAAHAARAVLRAGRTRTR